MSFQMINREKWFAGADSQTFRGRISDEQRAGKSRSAGGREGVDLIDRNVRGRDCALEQTRQLREMISRCDFRHDPAEFFVLGNLRRHFAGEQVRTGLAFAATQNRDCSFVAGCFNCENRHNTVVIPSESRGIPLKLPYSFRIGIPRLSLGMTNYFFASLFGEFSCA